MPVSKPLAVTTLWLSLVLGTLGGAECARASESPMHWSGNKTKWNRKTNIVELIGDASVQQDNESMMADHITLNVNTRHVSAEGNCRYLTADTLIESEKLDFNLDTRTGIILGGRVTNGRFLLSGEKINRISQNRYLTDQGEYTTCIDCPGSWSLFGQEVDLEFEGYAYMKNLNVKVSGTPVLWLPYAIFPMKRSRQSGFLFPKFGVTSNHGFILVEPYFWAINSYSDMTIGAGRYFGRGARFEWEGRYVLTPSNRGIFNYFYTNDVNHTILGATSSLRWGMSAVQSHILPWNVSEKLRLYEVSDSYYPLEFFQDINGQFQPALSSQFILSKASPDVSAYVEFRRIRNLLNFQNPAQFDSQTVQLLPRALITTNDRLILGTPIALGLTGEISNFTRSTGPIDYGNVDPVTGAPLSATGTPAVAGTPYVLGVDPIRSAMRVSYTPSVYTTLRPWKVLSVIPSAQYRGYFYSFGQDPYASPIRTLNRGYLLTQVEASAQWERVWETGDPAYPRMKNLIRPLIRYSRIPVYDQDATHPFVQQLGTQGYNFDNQDIIPNTFSPSLVNYFTPLGNSLTYGVTTQWIRKSAAPESSHSIFDSSYQKLVELSAGQSVDFLQLNTTDANKAIPLSRFFSNLTITTNKFQSVTDYNYIPYLNRYTAVQPNASPNEFRTSMTYFMESQLKRGLLMFQRSFTTYYNFNSGQSLANFLGFAATYSLSDYLMPSFVAEIDNTKWGVVDGVILARVGANMVYQSPSECWKFVLGVTKYGDLRGTVFTLDFQLNLTGEGYGMVSSPPPQ